MAPKILVVDDDPSISDMLTLVLETEGFEPVAVMDGNEAVQAFREHQPDLILLDLMLPGMNGVDICRAIRLESAVPIVMLTAKTDTVDVVLGLETGADDYITKPFRPRELRARISAMMRRPRKDTAPAVPEAEAAPAPLPAAVETAAVDSEDIFSHNGLVLDAGTRTTVLSGRDVELTRTEFDLLHALLESGRRVRSKTDLVRRLRGEDYDTGSYISESDERTIEVHVGNLRRKLGDDSRSPRWLETVRGVGYRLAPAN